MLDSTSVNYWLTEKNIKEDLLGTKTHVLFEGVVVFGFDWVKISRQFYLRFTFWTCRILFIANQI